MLMGALEFVRRKEKANASRRAAAELGDRGDESSGTPAGGTSKTKRKWVSTGTGVVA